MQRIKNNLHLILLVLVCLIPLFDLLNPGLPVTHDGQDHIARIANFYQNLKEGNAIPRWAGNLNWGYGHPVLMFLYPLPSYVSSVFHFLGFSYIDSLKIIFASAFVLSGLSMYLWINSFLGKNSAVVAAVLYAFAPYRFVDLYVRGAIGEHVAFIFPPLVLFFLFKLSKKFNYYYFLGGCASVAGLILSHNAISLMFLPFILFYAIFLVFQNENKKKLLFWLVGVLILGFGLSAFFLFPAFFEGKYTLRDIVTKGEYATRFVSFKDLIYGAWSYGGTGQFTVQIGIAQLLVLFFSPFVCLYLFKKKKSLLVLFSFVASFGFLAAIFMVGVSKPLWDILTILQKFQFPWRFLSIVVFSTATIGGIFVYSINKRQIFVSLGIIFLVLISTISYWHANFYSQKTDRFYEKIYEGTTDTGESSPIWSVRFMEKKAESNIELIEGEGEVFEISRNNTNHLYQINSKTKSRVRENTLYFPGWKTYVNGKEVPVEFQDPKSRGLITFGLEPGANEVKVSFQETKFRTLSNLISIFSLAVLIGLNWGLKQKRSHV